MVVWLIIELLDEGLKGIPQCLCSIVNMSRKGKSNAVGPDF